MKFRVSPKDLVMFIIFCIFLFYLCAIAVLNFSSFASTGTFYGLNPLEAFSSSYFPVTILMFAIVLIIIFASVSSYIFEKEKGSGLGLDVKKKEDNEYSRFATDKEMKNAFGVKKINIDEEHIDAAGVVLLMNKKEWYVDNSENHTLVIGATASGKTTSVVDPLVNTLARKGESMVLTDPKGEIYKNHAAMLKEKGYKVIVLNFRTPENGSSWNPLTLPYRLYKEGDVDKATELLEDVANNILKDKNANADPFWQNSASDYFSGCVMGLFEDAKEDEVNLNSVYTMTIQGDEQFGNRSTYIKEYFTMKGETSTPYIFASNVINAPKETQGGQLSTFREKIRIFASRQKLSEMLGFSDFEMRDIGREKTAVFIVIQDEKTTYHSLATIFIKQLYETLIAEAYKEKNGRLKYRTNFILDEFANMPALKDVTSMVTAARSRDIRFTFIIQNFAQLKDVYGDNDAQTIRSNCGNLIYLLTTELAALEEISKLCGVKKPKDKDKGVSERPLVSVTDLQKMKMNEVIIIKARMNPFKTKLTPSYELDSIKKYEKTDFYTREIKKVHEFDLKSFVKAEKQKQMKEQMQNSTMPTSMGTSMKPSMFSNSMFPSSAANPFNQVPNNFNPFANPAPKANNNFTFGNMNVPNRENSLNAMPSTVDIDEMIRQIDKQIEQLEKQEKVNQVKQPDIKLPQMNLPKQPAQVIETLDMPEEVNTVPILPQEIPNKSMEVEHKRPDAVPKINVDKDSKIVDEHIVTEDEFFDDFFGD